MYKRQVYGLDHATAVARVLAAWWFPEEFTAALGVHHDLPDHIRTNLGRALVGGEALAAVALGQRSAERLAGPLALVNLSPGAVVPLVERVRTEAEGLARSLESL